MTSANPSPAALANPAASRTVQVPVGSSSERGTCAKNDRDCISTLCCTGVVTCVVRSINRAPLPETSRAMSIPAERTPAPNGHSADSAASRSVSKVNSAIGTEASSSVFQSTRHQVSVSVSPMAARKMSAPLRAAGPSG